MQVRSLMNSSFIFLLVILFAGSCTSGPKNINLDEIDLEIKILRLDRDIFTIDPDSIYYHLPAIKEKYGEFFKIYNNLIIRIGNPGSEAYRQSLSRFLNDFDIYSLKNENEKIFPDLENIEQEIETGFKYFSHYFPGYPVPRIYTFISGFNQSIVAAENILGIGLDKYLGRDHYFYSQMQLPMFRRTNMYPEKIPADCMIGWAMTEFEFSGSDNLLGNMIYHGKMLYFAESVLPHQHDTLITGFTSDQLEWCRRNERNMWTYLIENRLLFSTDARTINSYINEGPFTSGFSRNSPARAAVWTGWQIVRSYMQRNNHLTLEELMLETDYQAILNKARYRP